MFLDRVELRDMGLCMVGVERSEGGRLGEKRNDKKIVAGERKTEAILCE